MDSSLSLPLYYLSLVPLMVSEWHHRHILLHGYRPACQRLVVFSYFLSYGFVFIFLFLYIIFLSRSLGFKGAPDCLWE